MVLFVPKVIVALLMLAFGAYFARFVGERGRHLLPQHRRAGRRAARQAGAVRHHAFVVVIALDQINIGGSFLPAS